MYRTYANLTPTDGACVAASEGDGSPVGVLQLLSTEALAALAQGVLDLNEIARATLRDRGADDTGRWIGLSGSSAVERHVRELREATAN